MNFILHKSLLLVAVFGIFSTVFSRDVSAQVAPSTVSPGQIERQFAPKIAPRVAPEEVVAPIDDVQEDLGDEIKFGLSGITLSGNDSISVETLQPLYSEYIGQDVSFNTLNDIAGAITEKYKDEGYVLARAYIPPQKVVEGNVEIKIVEGFVDKIMLDGDIQGSRALLDSFISKIRSSRPLRSEVLERYMLLMDDLPGVTARGLLRPSENTVGAADLVVTIKHQRTEMVSEVNNRGTRFLGRYQFSNILRANSWLEKYDRTFVRFVTVNQPQELKFLDIFHSQPVGTEGATLGASFVRTTSEPGSTLKSSEFDSENVSLELEYNYPVIRAREENLFLRLSGTYRDTNTNASGARLTLDKVRVLRVGGQYDKVDPLEGVNLIDIEVSQGVRVAGASHNDAESSRTNASGSFTKVISNISRYQPITAIEGMGILISGVGQFASGPLFASEEIGVGGVSFGKAFDPSEISGDHGAAGKVELQYGKFMGLDYLSSFQAYGFYDGGAIWNKSESTDEDNRSTLQSTGAGVRLNFTDDVSGNVEVAFPLTRAVASEGIDAEHDPRLFFSLVRNF